MARIPATTVSIGLMVLLSALDRTVVATALPTIASDFHDTVLYGWVFSAYAIPATATTLLYGRLTDALDRRRLFTIVALGFLLGSVLCGAAQSMAQLVAFRVVQGVFAGAIFPLAVAIIADTYPLERRAQGFSIVPTTFAFASVLGPVAGGFLTDTVGWRWIFYLNIPFVAVALAVFLKTYTQARRPAPFRLANLDLAGFVLFAAGTVGLLIGLSTGGRQYAWTSPPEALLLAGSVTLLLAFLARERRARLPLLPLRALGHRGLGGALLSILLLSLLVNTMIVLIPAYAQGVLNDAARGAGAVLIPLMLVWSVAANVSIRLGQRIGFRTMALCGTAALALGLALLAGVGMGGGQIALLAPMIFLGLGAGLINPNMMVLAQNSVSDRDQGMAGGLGNFALSLGSALVAPILVSAELARFGAHLGRSSKTAPDPAALLTATTRHLLTVRLGPAAVPRLQQALAAALHDIFLVAFAPTVLLLLWLLFVVPGNSAARRIRLGPLGASPAGTDARPATIATSAPGA